MTELDDVFNEYGVIKKEYQDLAHEAAKAWLEYLRPHLDEMGLIELNVFLDYAMRHPVGSASWYILKRQHQGK